MTTIIDVDGAARVTQINVFRVEPTNVEDLVAVLKEAATAVRDVPGWLSINLHVAHDRSKVANYAQCTTQAAWDEVMEILYTRGYIDRINELGTPEPCLYDVVWTLDNKRP